MLSRNDWGLFTRFGPIYPKKFENHKPLILTAKLRRYFNQIFNMNPKKRSEVEISCHMGI